MNFLKKLFSDEPGASFSRVATQQLIVAVIVWISFFLWKNSHFPDVVTIAALNALALSPYGLGKGVGTINRIFGKEGTTTGGQESPLGRVGALSEVEGEVRSQKPE